MKERRKRREEEKGELVNKYKKRVVYISQDRKKRGGEKEGEWKNIKNMQKDYKIRYK